MSEKPLFKMEPGGAIRRRRYTEAGRDHLVNVSDAVARRAEFLRLQYLGPGDDFEEEHHCAIFRDPKTDEVYGQPVEEPAETTEEPVEEPAATTEQVEEL